MPDENLLADLWRSGLKHVEINLDQRFVNLGYAIARKFCEQVVLAEVPLEKIGTVSGTVNRLLDLCLLVETHAYISATVQCDREVVRGIAHQVRNPVTVIGGNIRRLQRSLEASADSPVHKAYETIMVESRRLERMVADIRAYTEIFQTEGKFVVISLRSLISGALETLRERTGMEGVTVEMDLDPDWPDVVGHPQDLRTMFTYLLENSLEAVLPANPYVSIVSAPLDSPPRFLQVVIFNTGVVPRLEDMDLLFTPFYSSKPTGTGFGLPIARLIAGKNLGSVTLVPMSEHGTRCVVTLPIPDLG
jgi:signal transduction histidine kinase